MTHVHEHIDDETLSALVDEQLTPEAADATRVHLETCAACQEHLEGFHSVAVLLRQLPDVAPPRDFRLGPRLASVEADPPNVVRLRRWYTATRAAAASLAAVFVLLSAGTLYVDSQRAPPTQQLTSAAPRTAGAPAAGAAVQSAPPPATVGTRSAAAAPAASPIAPAAAVRSAPQTNQQAPDDQTAASTSVSSLPPTPTPTAVPTVLPPPVSAVLATAPPDQAAPLRSIAVAVGVLAVVALLAALVVRHRLQRFPAHI